MRSALDGLKAFRWLAEHGFTVEIEPANHGNAYKLSACWNGATSNVEAVSVSRYLQEAVMAVKQDVEEQLIRAGLIRRPTIDDHFASIGGGGA
jgi:hypothetical protein